MEPWDTGSSSGSSSESLVKSPRGPLTGLTRNLSDKFYTKKEVAEACWLKCQQVLSLDQTKDFLIEPSAGGGAFLNLWTDWNYVAYDLEPAHPRIHQADFLELDNLPETPEPIYHVIGNPPFGRQASLAKKFIQRCAVFANSISFILPRSFKKESSQKSVPLDFYLLFQMDLPPHSFEIGEQDHDVPCVFQIWRRQVLPRSPPISPKPNGFVFVKPSEDPDFSLRRVGCRAGHLSPTTEGKTVSTHYFIHLDDPRKKDTLLKRWQDIAFDHNNTVGPRSVSKPEVSEKINYLLRS